MNTGKNSPRRSQRSRAQGSQQSPEEWLAFWRARLQEPGPWTERLRRLADDLAQVNGADPNYHPEWEPMLEAYADDLASGNPIPRRYTPLIKHLETCKSCRAYLEDLVAALSTELSAPLTEPIPPPDLAFLGPPDPPLYLIKPLSQSKRASIGVVVYLSVQHLAELLLGSSPLLSRGVAEADRKLIMSAVESVDAHEWDVTVHARRYEGDPGRVELCAHIETDTTLPLQVRLRWGTQTFERPADEQGDACFDDLPAAILNADQAAILLEVEVVKAS